MSNKTKLTRAEKGQIQLAIDKAKNKPKGVKSAQDSIPFQKMFPDGICRVTDTYYTKTISFMDINYQIAQNEDKTAIFEGWCDFLNYFDSSIKFQLSFVNSTANENDFESSIHIESQDDDFDSIRNEYSEMLRNQLSRGNNGLVNEEMTAVLQSKERFYKYQEFVEENFKEAQAAKTNVEEKEYSSEEAKSFVKEHNADTLQRKSYEESLYTSVTVPVSKLMQDGDEVMCLELSEGLLKGVMVDSMDDKSANIFIKSDHQYSVVKPDGSKAEISGKDIINSTMSDATDAVTKAVTRKGR